MPDLVRDVAAALDDGEPLTLLVLVSSLLAALARVAAAPFERAPRIGRTSTSSGH